jgi:hypothetical protein
MAWHLMRVKNLPIGKRILNYGAQGKDVAQLQKLLNQAGFYFGEEDGAYGPLTEEAVFLFQKAYKLRIDGRAGPELFHILMNLIKNKKIGRIIYTIKEQDSLGAISEKFAVNENAWERLPGQCNPQKRIYPGMKLLLHEKTFLVWESPGVSINNLEVTGYIQDAWHIDGEGTLHPLVNDDDSGSYHLISAEPEIWETLLHTHKSRRNLIKELNKLKGVRFGFDLRKASLNNVGIKFIKVICRNFKLQKFAFLLLPLTLKNQGFMEEVFWLNLLQFKGFADLLLLQPIFDLTDPDSFETSAVKMFHSLKRLSSQGFSHKIITVLETGGWDWNLESGEVKQVTYKKAKVIHAMNSRTAKYSEKSKCTFIHYLSRGERHALVYREREGWLAVFKIIKQQNLLGVAVTNFTELGKTGKDIVENSFAVMAGKKLADKK